MCLYSIGREKSLRQKKSRSRPLKLTPRVLDGRGRNEASVLLANRFQLKMSLFSLNFLHQSFIHDFRVFYFQAQCEPTRCRFYTLGWQWLGLQSSGGSQQIYKALFYIFR